MKKTVLTWGLISGAISSAMMLATLPFIDAIGFDKSEILGYTTLVLSSLLVFFGVRSYRENAGAGRLTFGRGFLVGVLIALVSSACYVATWQFIYYKVSPDFLDKYAAHLVDKATASGASPEKLAEIRKQSAEFKKMFDNPAVNVALTFLEPLPIGLIAAALSAAALRRR
jgi:uncharacterized protein DUF4199